MIVKQITNIHIDFLQGRTAYRLRRASIRNELLARAVGLAHATRPSVIDATAGLGQDGFLLAKLGCEVTLLERSPVVAVILNDAIQRALSDSRLSHLNIHFIQANAITYLNELSDDKKPDVIYLDPMYPHRNKSSLVKKEMQLLQKIVGVDHDTTELFNIALRRARRRVVIKRPYSAESLMSLKPHHIIQGQKHRFDVYCLNNGNFDVKKLRLIK